MIKAISDKLSDRQPEIIRHVAKYSFDCLSIDFNLTNTVFMFTVTGHDCYTLSV